MPIQNGEFVKGLDLTVFLITGGQRRGVPNPETMELLGGWSQVRNVPEAELAIFPVGAALPDRRDGIAFRGTGPTVYIMQKGQRCAVPDPETLVQKYGGWGKVKSYTDTDITTIPEGTPLPSVKPSVTNDPNEYLRTLNYDARQILTIPEEGSTTSMPASERNNADNGVIICTNSSKSLKRDFTDVAILNPTTGVIFPGALIFANQLLAEGKPTPIALSRSPFTLSIDLPGAVKITAPITDPKASTVQAAIDEILHNWNNTASLEGYVNTARSNLSIKKGYSSQQLALELGFSAKWLSGSGSINLEVNSKQERSVTIAYYRQVFYTATFDTPTTPMSVFADSVSLDDIKRTFDTNNPPAYIRSVDYGRILMVRMETKSSETRVNLEAAMRYGLGPARVGAAVNSQYNEILQNSEFTVVALGGNPSNASRIAQPESFQNFEVLRDYIQAGCVYSKANPGSPIGYNVAFLKNNELAKIGCSTQYVERECVQYANGFVDVENAAGYVARFDVSWQEKDDAGGSRMQSWASGDTTAGYYHRVNLPGDATNVRIKAVGCTGLAWDWWGDTINVSENGPTNKRYKVMGTTLNRHWEKI
jgi:thiol-activated cytolysin